MACQYYGKYLCRRAINPEQNGNTPARHQFGMRTPAERDEEEGSHICGEWGAQKAWMFHVRCSDSSILFRDTLLMPKCIVFQAGDSIFGMSAADFAQRNQTEQIRLTENAMKGVWILTFQRNGEPRRRTSLDKSKKADILVSAARRPPLPPTQSLFVDGASSSCANSKAPKSPHLSEVSEDNMAMPIILSSDSGDDEDTVESFRKKLEKCSIKIPKKEPGINDTEEKVGRLLRAHRVVLNEMAYDLNSIPALDLAELTPDARCIAPPEAVRRGRHRIVRIPNTSRNGRGDFEADFEADLTGTEPHAFDLNYMGDSTMEFEFDMFERPLVLVRNDQDPALMEGASQGTSYSQPRIRRGNPSNTVQCGLCSQMGHNRRTCSNGGPSHS